MKRSVFLGIMITFLVLVSGCTSQKNNDTSPASLCIQLCKEKLGLWSNILNGPCLSNNITPDWACDIAHNPRIDIDNNPANQCPAYGKTAQHFVEVDTSCNLIRVV
ncbi:MAG: hypothetical protein NT120_00365 [Candidatus Aenigmarchaeota archaeon]|nr:hypothetical protein [Candidatus Aenigmarchaeota archaeon]